MRDASAEVQLSETSNVLEFGAAGTSGYYAGVELESESASLPAVFSGRELVLPIETRVTEPTP